MEGQRKTGPLDPCRTYVAHIHHVESGQTDVYVLFSQDYPSQFDTRPREHNWVPVLQDLFRLCLIDLMRGIAGDLGYADFLDRLEEATNALERGSVDLLQELTYSMSDHFVWQCEMLGYGGPLSAVQFVYNHEILPGRPPR